MDFESSEAFSSTNYTKPSIPRALSFRFPLYFRGIWGIKWNIWNYASKVMCYTRNGEEFYVTAYIKVSKEICKINLSIISQIKFGCVIKWIRHCWNDFMLIIQVLIRMKIHRTFPLQIWTKWGHTRIIPAVSLMCEKRNWNIDMTFLDVHAPPHPLILQFENVFICQICVL